MIHYNSPDHIEERAKVQPLNTDETKNTVDAINHLLNIYAKDYGFKPNINGFNQDIQRLIWDYENLCHMRAVTGKVINEQQEIMHRAMLGFDIGDDEELLSFEQRRDLSEFKDFNQTIRNVGLNHKDILSEKKFNKEYDKFNNLIPNMPLSNEIGKKGLSNKLPLFSVWINVNDALPELETAYICSFKNGGVGQLWFKNKLSKRITQHFYDEDTDGYVQCVEVTHWMPLPEPPKTEQI